ncbi:MAG: hypothetical protein R3C10_18105 [Pirellulales bacterium]
MRFAENGYGEVATAMPLATYASPDDGYESTGQQYVDAAVQLAGYATVDDNAYPTRIGAATSQAPGPSFKGPDASQRLDHALAADQSDDWRALLDRSIEALQRDVEADGRPSEIDRAAALRLLYLVANRRDDALAGYHPVDDRATPPEWEQEFWRSEAYGLSLLMYDHDQPGEAKRGALALTHLRKAESHLSDGADLVVKNLTFITSVSSFGNYDAVDEPYEFAPGEQVLLYAEVANFRSDSDGAAYETQLSSSYEIRDAQGRRVHEQAVEPHPDRCLSRRHDYYMGLKFNLPSERMYEETYTLVLTVEDTLAKKFAQASIPFRIKYADRERVADLLTEVAWHGHIAGVRSTTGGPDGLLSGLRSNKRYRLPPRIDQYSRQQVSRSLRASCADGTQTDDRLDHPWRATAHVRPPPARVRMQNPKLSVTAQSDSECAMYSHHNRALPDRTGQHSSAIQGS